MGREIVGGRTSFCFAARKLEALGRTTTTVKLTVGHTPLVSKPKIPYIIPNAGLTKVHPTVNDLFAGKIIPAVPYAGRLMCFLNSSKMLARDQDIFSTKEGYKITSPHDNTHMNLVQENLVDTEISEMLTKGAITVFHKDQKKGFLSHLFLVGKRDGSYGPVINLKELNKHIPYQHFKIEGLHYLKFILQKGDYMFNLDLKDAYFSVLYSKEPMKVIRFRWLRNHIIFEICVDTNTKDRIFSSKSILDSNHCRKKRSFPLRILLVNVTKSAGNCGFGHICRRNS